MKTYKIELLLKINIEENTVLNQAEKIVNVFNLNDKIDIRKSKGEKHYRLKYNLNP